MIHLMLNDLRSPAGVSLHSHLKVRGLIPYLDGLISLAFTGATEKRQTTFFGVVRAVLLDDFGVEHHRICRSSSALVKKGNDAFAHTYHICRHLAFDNPNLKATAYFGIINTDVLGKIKNSVPNLPKESKETLFKPGRDYSVATTLDSIRHIVDEKALNREDVINYLDRLADTILEFDTVTFNFYIKGKEKLPGLLFKKRFSDGTLVSFNLISHKKRSLNLQTLYMDGADYQKKRNAETMLMRKAHSNTSKTLVGQTSDNIIPQTAEFVKPSEEKKMYSDRSRNIDRDILESVLADSSLKQRYFSQRVFLQKYQDEQIRYDNLHIFYNCKSPPSDHRWTFVVFVGIGFFLPLFSRIRPHKEKTQYFEPL